jgi:hypothetical protein
VGDLCGDVQCDRVVLHYADVESIRTVELDVRTWVEEGARAQHVSKPQHGRIGGCLTYQRGAQDIFHEDDL